MGRFSLRSLLLAAVVISNCITWTASRHHFTHNASGHRSRHRRQGAGLYLPASYVLPEGEGSGAWGEWGETTPCSRTCGGGVASQKRICLEFGPDGSPSCTGGDTKYFSCQTQDCPDGGDFRAQQCAEHDPETFRGIKYHWVPYTKAPNPCELNCMPKGERFYYRQKPKVVDGTLCGDESFNVCVDGTCQPVGCDMMLGSNAREDKCRQCRGNNTNCHTVTGNIGPETELRKGYNDVLLIPQGATSIYISEVRDSNNYLALRSKRDNQYYLNGEYHIDFPRALPIAGSIWHYERSQQGFAAPDKLRCQGPTTEPLYLSLLLQDENVGIEYEYSVPSSLAPPPNQQYNWVHDDFSECTATCGGGFQQRTVTCRSREELEVVDDSLCDDAFKPPANQSCNTQPCAARWVEGAWSPCSKPCGESGTRSRTVHCEKIITNGYPSIVADKECFELLGPKPELYQECNNKAGACPKWYTEPWKPCDKLCGEGTQTRRVLCYQKSESGRIEVLPEDQCTEEKPPAAQSCILHPCEGVDWVLSDWSGCDSCLSKVRTRNAECVSVSREVVNASFCANHPIPVLEEPCDRTKLPPCEVQWYATQWSNCSVECGKGTQSRRVFCGLFDGSSVVKVGDDRCDADDKYNDTKPCEVPSEKCTAKWFAGPWEKCTKECGGGEQKRRVMCLRGGEEVKDCDGEILPDTTQICNDEPCNADDVIPVDSSSTPIMDEDYEEECDDDYDLEGLEEEDETETTAEDMMSSDEPSTPEGSSEGSSTAFTEIESEFTESGSGSEPTITDTTFTESSGYEPTRSTEPTETGSTNPEDTDSTLSTISSETLYTSESPTSDTSASETSSETSESGPTETSSASETVGTESTDSSSSSKSDLTEATDISTTGSDITESSVTDFSSTSESSTEPTETSTTSESAETTDASTTNDETTGTDMSTEDNTGASSTESGSTDLSSTTDLSGTTKSVTDTGSTEPTESKGSTTEESTDTSSSTNSGPTESTEPTETAETGGTTESGEPTESEGTTESGPTTETGSSYTDSTETSESEPTEETESTDSDGSSTTEISSSEGFTEETTPWDWSSTVDLYTTKKSPRCKPRKKSKCHKSEFGCCPDKKTAAKGPFDQGCPTPTTCKETKFGCCPDGVSPAAAKDNHDCPVPPCKETLFGCCKSDNKTPAEGNDQEGCPPPPPACRSSKYKCCKDGKTPAKGPKQKGCPEKEPKKGCKGSKFGCCHDNKTEATGPNEGGCPCNITQFGCCPDHSLIAQGPHLEGCVMSCNTSAYGCCPDGETPAHGPDYEGCCLQYAFGCCPDNYKPAEGPHFEGCSCQHARFGCCPDNDTIARGPNNEGCGCQYTQLGCCPDRHTEATGPDYEGCGCSTYQFGCCADGATIAKGPQQQGCHCQQSKFGCCGDGQTAATGPDQAGCDCSTSKYGCCPDGQHEAKGEKFLGCTDVPENRQAACSLLSDRGSCRNYSVSWFYDMDYGGCSRFWYGGCEGNGNRFSSKEECEDVCVQPSPKDACKLPQVKGACQGYYIRWYYDSAREQCGQFAYGGCLGNANNFESHELCQERCEPLRSNDQCKLPIEQGPCAGNFGRWGFNAETRNCEQFIWGGCEGNSNRFQTEAACLLRCNPPGALQPECSEQQEVGNCTKKLARWSFSQTENRCVPFYYTGCGGNRNSFEAEQDCTRACPSAYVQDVCTLPALTGECANYRERWYYDTVQKRCRQFYYGGCGGNGNNFASEQECQGRCTEFETTTTVRPQEPAAFSQELCFLEKDPGPCNDFQARWAYDAARGACTTFDYGGCAGNRNNFPSQQHCQYYCETTQDICQLPMRAGPCDASFMRWFYDPASDTCSQFTYGGCDGNDNRFDTLEDCERRCRSQQPATTTVTPATQPQENIPEECKISSSLEQCVGAGTVWYWESSRRECMPFQNADSGANCRRTGAYPSEEACLQTCGVFRGIEVCRYPVDPGPCTQFDSKYYFDSAANRCVEFSYGGCHGGPNRFSSAEECEQVCKPETDPCKQRPEPGNCLAYLVRWYYDEVRDTCQQFVYGGCNGNNNNFNSQQECEGRCRRQPPAQATTERSRPTPPQTVQEECRTPDSLEPCGSNITVFYYDAEQRGCRAADFGGCRHPNSYRSEEECERRCGAFQGLDVCGSPVDAGPCRASIPKVYWDADSGRCHPFAYGGCHGGPNRFSSEDECEEVCGNAAPDAAAACLQAADSGTTCVNGEPAQRRWYYNNLLAECTVFVYSGCGGNDNNFHSHQQCEQLCAALRPDGDGNEVLPDCDRFNEECARIRCPYSVQRTRTAQGCERCSCVQVEVDCERLTRECDQISCVYGVQRSRGDDGCDRCKCIEHPCAGKECPPNERCVALAYQDPETQETRYTAECRTANKPGTCPSSEEPHPLESSACRRECNDDADCSGASKCCEAGCSRRCLEPAAPSSPAPPQDPNAPELPQAPQASSETEPEVTSSEGSKATLRCLFHGNPPPKITWRRGEITIDGTVGRYRLLSDGALEIVSLYRNDSGVYICLADNGLGTARQEVRLQVNDPVSEPAGISGEQNSVVTGELGQSLNIRCLAYGFPAPAIAWYRGPSGPMVPYSSSQYEARENVLQIRILNLNTLGEYTCQAYNGQGKPASWTVVVQAWRDEVSPSDSPYLVPRGDPGYVAVTPREPRTQATSPPEPAPAPEPYVPVYTVPVTTRIVAESTTIGTGSELSLPCEVDGYPVPDVHWTKDNVRLQPSDRMQVTDARLTISSTTAEDSGVYGCHAANAFSSHYSTVQISVQGLFIPTKCTDNPFFADCHLIVRSKFCRHKYYSRFCCKSCVEAGQLNPADLDMQADEPFRKK